MIRGSLPAGEPPGEGLAAPAPETIIAKRQGAPLSGARSLDVTSTIAEVFERARSGNTSYLTRFGVKNALVVLSQNGTQTSWQVPDFSVDLEHKDNRSLLVGQANIASTKGDWQLEVRTEQRTRRQSLTITALIQNLIPSGLAGNFPSLGALKALDLPVLGEPPSSCPIPASSCQAMPSSNWRPARSRRLGTPIRPCASTMAICIFAI